MQGSFVKHFLILSAGTVANMVLGLITTPIITRMVDPSFYGSYSLFSTYGTLTLSIVGLGMDSALVRYFYMEEDEQYRTALLKFCYVLPNLVFALLSLLGILAVLIIRPDLVSSDNTAVLIAFIVYVFILILSRNTGLVLRLHYRTEILAWTSVLNKVVFASIAIVGLWITGGEQGFAILVAALLAGYFVITLYQLLPERRIWRQALKKAPIVYVWREALKYGLPFVAATAVGSFLSSAGQIFLGLLATDSDVGVFAAAITISHIFAIIQSSFNTLWAPASVENYEKNPDDRTTYIRAHRVMALAMISLGLLFVLFKDVIVFLLGARYRGASLALPFLCLQPVFYTLSETTVCGMVFMKRSDYQLYSSGIACVCNIILCTLLIPIFGVRGAAIATGLSYLLFFCARSYFSNLVFPIDYGFKDMTIASLLLLGLCIWATFSDFTIIMIPYYIIAQIIILVIYRESLQEILKWAKMKFKHKRNG